MRSPLRPRLARNAERVRKLTHRFPDGNLLTRLPFFL
jgi:hypothetical protein